MKTHNHPHPRPFHPPLPPPPPWHTPCRMPALGTCTIERVAMANCKVTAGKAVITTNPSKGEQGARGMGGFTVLALGPSWV